MLYQHLNRHLCDTCVRSECTDLPARPAAQRPRRVISCLRNPALQKHHFALIDEIVGRELSKDPDFTLGVLIDLKVMDLKDDIQTVSNTATQEAALEELVLKVQKGQRPSCHQISPLPAKPLKRPGCSSPRGGLVSCVLSICPPKKMVLFAFFFWRFDVCMFSTARETICSMFIS